MNKNSMRAASADEVAAQYDAALRPFIPSDSVVGRREILSRYQDRALWHRIKARVRYLFGRI